MAHRALFIRTEIITRVRVRSHAANVNPTRCTPQTADKRQRVRLVAADQNEPHRARRISVQRLRQRCAPHVLQLRNSNRQYCLPPNAPRQRKLHAAGDSCGLRTSAQRIPRGGKLRFSGGPRGPAGGQHIVLHRRWVFWRIRPHGVSEP